MSCIRLACLSLVALSIACNASAKELEVVHPDYKPTELEGWTLHISERLQKDMPEKTEAAIELLRKQLQEIVRVVPKDAVEKLQEVPLWMSPQYPGVGPRAEYHPGAGWLKDNGRPVEMVKGIEFTNVRIFEAETRRMPNFALHELAHAYHDRVLGFEEPGTKVAFESAVKSGKYEKVKRRDAAGNIREGRHYGMTNHKEYFAESTESFFSTNDFFPFVRQELKEYDPAMFVLLGELWGQKQP